MLMLCEPLANLARRDQQDFLCACESLGEGFGLRVVLLTKLHTQLCQARSIYGITNDCNDLPCWHLFQKTLDGVSTNVSTCSCYNDHRFFPCLRFPSCCLVFGRPSKGAT